VLPRGGQAYKGIARGKGTSTRGASPVGEAPHCGKPKGVKTLEEGDTLDSVLACCESDGNARCWFRFASWVSPGCCLLARGAAYVGDCLRNTTERHRHERAHKCSLLRLLRKELPNNICS
jgi:hypothetical protein